jgi:hypothetical protein
MRRAASLTGALAVYSEATSLFGSEDLLAPPDRPHWYHHHMTVRAALAAGWERPAAEELAWHNVGVDLYCIHPVWWVRGGPRRVRAARLGRVPLRALHFDSLRSPDDVLDVRRRVEGGMLAALHWAARTQDVLAARNALGTGLHALQDFYSHSTWIDAPERRRTTWAEHLARGDRSPAALRTAGSGPNADRDVPPHGDIRPTTGALLRLPAMLLTGPEHPHRGGRPGTGPAEEHPRHVGPDGPAGLCTTGPEGINLDSRWQSRTGVQVRGVKDLDGDGAFETAVRLAVRESREVLESMGERLRGREDLERFWSRVRNDPSLPWTNAFDDPHRLAYWFLTAGTYPPRGSLEASEWFLRVLVTTPGRRPGSARTGTGPGRTVRLRASDRTGSPLTEWVCPLERAGAVGPLPAGTAFVGVHGAVGPVRISLHAFVRHPEPRLVELSDAAMAEGAARFPFSPQGA